MKNELEIEKYKLMGTAVGINLDHVLILGEKHNKDFFNRLVGYKIIKNNPIAQQLHSQTGNQYVSVEFYENMI